MSVRLCVKKVPNTELTIVNEHYAKKLIKVEKIAKECLYRDFTPMSSKNYNQLMSKLPLLSPVGQSTLELGIETGSHRVKLSLKGPFLEHLQNLLGKQFSLKVILTNFIEKTYEPPRSKGEEKRQTEEFYNDEFGIVTSYMEPRKCLTSDDIFFEDVFPLEEFLPFGTLWSTSKWTTYTVDVNIMVRCKNLELDSDENDPLQPSISDLKEYTKKLWTNKVGTDVIIVSGNKAEIPCHKLFLTASSPVFQTMFQYSKFKEGQTHRIEIPDMSELGVHALLHYLYCMEVCPTVNDFDIALELLEASEKYSIDSLKTAMKKIFLNVSDDWYPNNRGGVFQLFLFARGATDCSDLKEKAFEILRSKPESSEFDQLLAKHPAAAIELCTALLNAEKLNVRDDSAN